MCAIYSHIVTFVRKVFDIFSEIFIIRPTRRRGVRVAEGAPLLREYRVCSSIEGSNPSLSTILNLNHLIVVFLCLKFNTDTKLGG